MRQAPARGPTTTNRFTAAPGFMIAAGLIHLAIAPSHWAHAPVLGAFMVVSGLVEIAWGVAFWRWPSAALYRAGVVLVGGLVTLYVITRIFPAPFHDHSEDVEIFGLTSKLFEGLGAVTLAVLAVSGTASWEAGRKTWRSVATLVMMGFVLGWLTYGLASAADQAGIALVYTPTEYIDSAATLYNGDLGVMRLVGAGAETPSVEGSEVAVTGDLVVGLALEPGNTRLHRSLDVYLHRRGTQEGISNARVEAVAYMRSMDEEYFEQLAMPSDNGHYLLSLPFVMRGEWVVALEIATEGQSLRLVLNLDLIK